MDGSSGSVVEEYLIALLAVAVAAVATILLWPFSESAPFGFFYAAVAVAARRGGVGPRLTASLGSAAVGAYAFLPPHRSFQLHPHSVGALVVFLVVSTIVGWLAAVPRGWPNGFQTRRRRFETFMERPAEGRITHLGPIAGGFDGWSLSGELSREILDNCDVCIKLLDLDGRIRMINEYGARMLELADGRAWVGRDMAELWPEEFRGVPRDAARRAALGERVHFTGFAPTAKGRPKWWDVTVAPILGADGKPEKVLGVSRDVTELKRAEDSLRAGQERYRTLFNSIDEGFCVIEMIFDDESRPVDLRYLEANPAFETLTGERDVVGRTLRELSRGHEDGYRDYWFEIYGRVALTGEPARFANLEPAVGGRWYDLHAFRVGAPDDRRVAVLFRNITEIVLAERASGRLAARLENQRAELARLIEKAPAFMVILRGPDHIVELTNEKSYEFAGRRDALGRPLAEVVPEGVEQGYIAILDRVYRTGEEYIANEAPFVVDRKGDGEPETRYMNVVYQATRDPDGSINGVFVHGVDITEQVEAARAIKESEARFRQMADAMPQAVWTARPDGTVEFLNRKFLEYTALPDAPFPRERWRDVIHPDDYEMAAAAWRRLFGSDEPIDLEYRIKRASDGRYRWHLARALSIKNDHGEVVRRIGTNTDIDDFKRLSESIKEADRRKDEFLAVLAHELRNPLAPIRTGLQILKAKPNEDVFATTVEMMTRQLGHMIHLIDDLLDVARVGSGKIVLKKERVSLRSVVESALEAGRQNFEAKGQELRVSFADAPVWLEADPTRLAQVVSNLLTNAAKYTNKGGRIEVSAAREGDEAVVRVKDTGDGIEAEMLTRIFEMFNQVGSSIGHSQGGLGIGLTVVKRLVELHGGRIEARSDGLGHGSEFIVRLPIAAGGVERENRGAPAPGDGSARKLRVLVVDDNRDSADTLARVVGLAGHEAKTAYGGDEALAAAESFRPDIVLLDIGLPGLNGYEVAQRIRQNPELRETRLVAVTGWGQAEDRRRSDAAGFDLHLVKPVDPSQLKTLLESGVDAAELASRPPRQSGATARTTD